MPKNAPKIKINNTREYGADVILYDAFFESREKIGNDIKEKENRSLVKPYDDIDVIAGQGTAGIEIVEDLKKLSKTPDIQLCCCGGGGLIAGTSTYLKHQFPNLKTYSVEPSGFDDTKKSLENKKITENLPNQQSICDALLAPKPGNITFPINVKNDFKKSSDQKVFLVIGGSQGAKFFQTELKNTLNKLSKKFNLFVYHQTSAENFKDLEIFYKQNNIDYQLFDFESYLESILLKTDFCITRAGASTLAELAFFEVPFLAIPFPYSKDDHQVYNAKYYKDNNCCWMLDQKEALQKNLFEIISNILVDKKNLQLKKKAMNEMSSKNTWEKNNKIILNTINLK